MATGQMMFPVPITPALCDNANLPVASSTTDMTGQSARYELVGGRKRIVFPKGGIVGITHTDILPPLHSTTHGYNGSGLTLVFNLYGISPAASGNVRFQAAVERCQSGTTNATAEDFAAAQAATLAINATLGVETTYNTIAFTSGAQMDSAAAGEMVRIRLQRVGTSALDTYNGDVAMEFFYVRET